ncbi:MAG: multidrug transporter [Oceanospirillaceae bacterium]|nr:multidrug transporter [Oceanospirillaceae bacterium]
MTHSSSTQALQPYLVFMLAALSALTPLAIDIYLAAIPTIADQLQVPFHDVEISISLYMISFSVGQLLGGPFSDYIGRRASVRIGLGIFVIASTLTLAVPTLEMLWLSRVLQAFGGGLASVNAAAIIRDVSRGKEGAANLVRVVQVMMLAPLIAPLLGMIILKLVNWQAIFGFLLLYSAALLVLFHRQQQETRQTQVSGNLFQRYAVVLKERRSWRYIATVCTAYASLLTCVTISPGVYMGHFGISEVSFPLYFALNVFSLLAASRLNLRMLKQHEPGVLIEYGQTAQVVLGLLLLTYVLVSNAPSFWIVMPGLTLMMGCHGLLISNSTASTTEYFPNHSATATALLGSLGFVTGGLTGWATSLITDGSSVALVAVMSAAAMSGILLRRVLPKGADSVEQPELKQAESAQSKSG